MPSATSAAHCGTRNAYWPKSGLRPWSGKPSTTRPQASTAACWPSSGPADCPGRLRGGQTT
eukprot:1197122-Lingulodinium_polyedra.AAC.1